MSQTRPRRFKPNLRCRSVPVAISTMTGCFLQPSLYCWLISQPHR